MRFLHTADWHIGKKFNGYDLLADQRQIIDQILAIAQREAVDVVVIAGDLYDRGVPPVEAVALFNEKVAAMNLTHKLPLLAIAGNHDSSVRLETGGPWFSHTDFYLHTRLDQAFTPVVLGDTQFFLLPYFEPIAARLAFEDEQLKTISEAMVPVIAKIKEQFDPEKRHVLVTHFFVAGALRTDSETKIEVGGLDNVPAELLADFDYVALGHLHGKDAIKHPTIQYSGSPLKFSLSEAKQEKGVFIVDTEAMTREFVALTPAHDVGVLTASYAELLDPTFYNQIRREDFWQIKLTDRAVIPNLMNTLRGIYPRILGVERVSGVGVSNKALVNQSQLPQERKPQELVTDFFIEMTGEELSSPQLDWLQKAFTAITKQ